MGIAGWLDLNWFNLAQTLGIIASLLFTAWTLHTEAKTRRVSNLLAITESHRTLWTEFYAHPELSHILDDRADPRQKIRREEEIFFNLVLFHLNSVYYAYKSGLVLKLEGLRRDISWFFSLPIPRVLWEKSKVMQNDDFAAFVESCRNWK